MDAQNASLQYLFEFHRQRKYEEEAQKGQAVHTPKHLKNNLLDPLTLKPTSFSFLVFFGDPKAMRALTKALQNLYNVQES